MLLLESCQVSLVLACWLLQKRLKILYYRYVDVRHMIQDCAQTVLHMLQCVPWVCLAGLVIHGQIVVELCGLVGCCSLHLYRLHSQSERLGILWAVLPIVVSCVLWWTSCSLEAFDWGFRLLISNEVWGGVLTLKVVWWLFLCVNVFDHSLFTILIV